MAAMRTHLGSSQAVRQRVLVPPCAGSNPASPAPLAAADDFRPDVAVRGQVFTPQAIARQMLALRENRGRIMEPAAGDGAFVRFLESRATAIEIDPRLARDGVLTMDFFDYPRAEKFDTIVSNPPYVRWRDIGAATRAKLDHGPFDQRANLFLFFIRKAMDHLRAGGELIFVTPRDFVAATSARNLNRALYEEGSFTHFYDLGDARVFPGFSPNCAIWRWVKGAQSRRIQDGRIFECRNGLICFNPGGEKTIGDYFQVRVGAVSGADRIFADEKRGCTDFVFSRTAQSGETRRMIYERRDRSLYPHKPELLRRRVRRFDESNWWRWGRGYYRADSPRLYVNCKTRHPRPFFSHAARAWDGSVLALFPKAGVNLARMAKKLNDANWGEMGFVCDGRFLFTQRSLTNAPL